MISSNLSVQMADSVQPALDYLQDNLGFRCGNILGKGTYGSVVRVTSREMDVYAAKIVQRRLLNELEVIVWPKLKHNNILRLFETITDVDGFVIFLTDLMVTNLFLRLQSKDFKEDSKALERCRTYARQVFTGISYLHSHKLCHLDLRCENVFLAAEDDRAVVADFSGLSWSEPEKKFCPLPQSLRPPEMLISKKRVSPVPVDLWACGLLLANLFLGKGFYICTVKSSRAGQLEAVQQYTGLFQCEVYILKFLSETYTNCALSYSSMKDFIHMVHKFLNMNPKSRLKVDEALSHPFFAKQSICETRDVRVLDRGIDDLPLVLQQQKDGHLLDGTGTSEQFQVTFSKKSEGKAGSSTPTKSFRIKSIKANRWSKYKRWWTEIGKLRFRSTPLFKYIKFRKPAKKKAKKIEAKEDRVIEE